MRHPETTSTTSTTPITIEMPPPGVGIKAVLPPTNGGTGISIILKPADSSIVPTAYSMDGAGVSTIDVGVTMSDGSVLTGTVPKPELDLAIQALNSNLEPTVYADLEATVDSLSPDPNAVAVGVLVDGMFRLKFGNQGIGTIVWGYNLNLDLLAALVKKQQSQFQV